MSDQTPAPEESRTYELRAERPLPALVLAAVSALLGAVLVVLWRAGTAGWPLLVVGVLALLLGLALVLASLVLARRLRQTAVLDQVGIGVTDRAGVRALAWPDVAEVTLQGVRMVLVAADGHGPSVEVVNPRGPSQAVFLELLEDVRTRLDADRGYRPLE